MCGTWQGATGNNSIISLKKSASYWADEVLKYANGYERKNMQEEIKKAGFDIKETVKWVEKFYLEE